MFVSQQQLENQGNNNDDNNNNNNKIDNYISKPNLINSDDLKSTTVTNKVEKKEEKEEGKNHHQISFKSTNSCKICNLSIIIKTKKTSSTNHHLPFSIKALKSYLITTILSRFLQKRVIIIPKIVLQIIIIIIIIVL
jgi:hypothetical protein